MQRPCRLHPTICAEQMVSAKCAAWELCHQVEALFISSRLEIAPCLENVVLLNLKARNEWLPLK